MTDIRFDSVKMMLANLKRIVGKVMRNKVMSEGAVIPDGK